MRRIYFTAVPLDDNFTLTPAENKPANFALSCNTVVAAYPIIPIIMDSLQPGDEAIVIAIRQTVGSESANYALLLAELATVGVAASQVHDITIAHAQSDDILLALFSDLIAQAKPDSCYYACATFGTKTYPMVLFSALQYITKILDNTQLKGIYYREVRRAQGVAVSHLLYDISTLFSLNQIIDLVANTDTTDKAAAIKLLLQ